MNETKLFLHDITMIVAAYSVRDHAAKLGTSRSWQNTMRFCRSVGTPIEKNIYKKN